MLKRLKRAAESAWRHLLALLFPSRCICYRRLVGGLDDTICPACEKNLPMAAGRGEECLDARKKHIEFAAAVVAPFYYKGAVREALVRYKFSGMQSYAPVFAAYAAEAVRRAVENRDILMPELVTYVPVSKKRLRKRGYDQARLFAAELAKRLGLPLARLLDKPRDTPAQSELDERARRANVVGAYRTVEKNAALAAGKHILLVDDVITTGATMAEAAKTVAFLLPASVVCVAAAQTELEKSRKRLKSTDECGII